MQTNKFLSSSQAKWKLSLQNIPPEIYCYASCFHSLQSFDWGYIPQNRNMVNESIANFARQSDLCILLWVIKHLWGGIYHMNDFFFALTKESAYMIENKEKAHACGSFICYRICTFIIILNKWNKDKNKPGKWYSKIGRLRKEKGEKIKILPQNFAFSIRILHLNQWQLSHLI